MCSAGWDVKSYFHYLNTTANQSDRTLKYNDHNMSYLFIQTSKPLKSNATYANSLSATNYLFVSVLSAPGDLI